MEVEARNVYATRDEVFAVSHYGVDSTACNNHTPFKAAERRIVGPYFSDDVSDAEMLQHMLEALQKRMNEIPHGS